MGQKVNPIGFRLGVYRNWDARWYADKEYTKLLHEDLAMRRLIGSRLRNAGVARIETERSANQLTVIIHTAKPGIVIGKQGASVDALRDELERISGKKVRVTIHEIKTPELDATLVAENVASQLEKRIAFRRALKQTLMRSMRAGVKGAKIQVSGRLGGSEMSRREWDRDGRRGGRRGGAEGREALAEAGDRAAQAGRREEAGDGIAHRQEARAQAGGAATHPRRTRRGRGVGDADAQADQAPQAPSWSPYRRCVPWQHAQLRLVWAPSGRTLLDDQPSDRGGSTRDDAPRQAWRQDLDPRVSRPPVHQEAGGDTNGQWQGSAGRLGGGRAPRPHPVRDGGRHAGDCA